MTRNLSELRREYTRGVLDRQHVDPDPTQQFARWMNEAVDAQVPEPNAMTLATADHGGLPDARIVLLKGFDRSGLVFYTNYHSAKGRQLEANPAAALVFHWIELERQVRIRGTVSQVGREESETYFHSRPLGSRLGALASLQSEVVEDRHVLEQRFREIRERHDDGHVPVPPHWGGYRVAPTSFEFWQGRHSRLHDRIRYRLATGGHWILERLEP